MLNPKPPNLALCFESSDTLPQKRIPKPRFTWTPKVCKIMALMAVIMGLGPLFYIFWGFRYGLRPKLARCPQLFIHPTIEDLGCEVPKTTMLI